jgi:hypothetical protein
MEKRLKIMGPLLVRIRGLPNGVSEEAFTKILLISPACGTGNLQPRHRSKEWNSAALEFLKASTYCARSLFGDLQLRHSLLSS